MTRRQVMFGVELAVNVGLPWCVYWVAKRQGLGEAHAIMCSAISPILWSLAEFARRRRVDAISMLVLGGIALSLIGFALGGSPKLLLMRESLVTGLIGVAFLGSVLVQRPLVWVLAQAAIARQGEPIGEGGDVSEETELSHAMMVITLVWGAGLVAEACLRTVLVTTMSVGRVLVVGPVVGYSVVGLLIGWTYLYAKRLE